MSTLKELREKLDARNEALNAVFVEAKTDDGQIDFNKVTCLGDDVKGSVAVATRVNEMNAEINEIGEEVETLQNAEKAAWEQEQRAKQIKRPTFPGPSDDRGEQPGHVKSLGCLVGEEKRFQDFAKSSDRGSITLNYDDALPSDLLAKGMQYQTLGRKALFETTAGWSPESVRLPGFVEMATRPPQIIDVVPLAQTGQEQVVYMEETTRTHGAAETAEGGTYPESTFVLTEKTSSVRKIADSVPVTDEQLEDVAQVQSYLDGRLIFGVRQRLDSQMLVGDGTGSNLRGLKNVAGIQTQAKGADPTPDAFFKAMRKIRVNGRAMPTHHLIHPEDWENIRLLRTADGIYIWGNPSEAGPERMWGLPVVQQDADAAGTGYVGSFEPAWISAYERRGVDVQIGHVGTQFVEGKRTIRADMRIAFVVFRPAAFSTVTGL